MPTICLFSSITGRRRTCFDSMSRAAVFALLSALQANTPFVMMSFAMSSEMSLPLATALERIPVTWKRSLHVGSNWCILAG